MTHQENYGNNRLAIYTFENAVRFVNCWTNFKLKWMDPLKMGLAYFQRFPDERIPVWSGPQRRALVANRRQCEIVLLSSRVLLTCYD